MQRKQQELQQQLMQLQRVQTPRKSESTPEKESSKPNGGMMLRGRRGGESVDSGSSEGSKQQKKTVQTGASRSSQSPGRSSQSLGRSSQSLGLASPSPRAQSGNKPVQIGTSRSPQSPPSTSSRSTSAKPESKGGVVIGGKKPGDSKPKKRPIQIGVSQSPRAQTSPPAVMTSLSAGSGSSSPIAKGASPAASRTSPVASRSSFAAANGSDSRALLEELNAQKQTVLQELQRKRFNSLERKRQEAQEEALAKRAGEQEEAVPIHKAPPASSSPAKILDRSNMIPVPSDIQLQTLGFFETMAPRMKMFQGVDSTVIHALMEHLTVITCETNVMVIEAGTEGHSMFFLITGECEVLVTGKKVTELTAPCSFGEIALLLSGGNFQKVSFP